MTKNFEVEFFQRVGDDDAFVRMRVPADDAETAVNDVKTGRIPHNSFVALWRVREVDDLEL